MHMPLTFSIITCTWNSAQFLDEAIASILAQDYPYIEMIFVDGGSTDGTLEKIRSLSRPHQLIENIRGGVSNAMNVGIRHATGDVIAHLHSDDYYLSPYVLSKVAQQFESNGCAWISAASCKKNQASSIRRTSRLQYLAMQNFLNETLFHTQRHLYDAS